MQWIRFYCKYENRQIEFTITAGGKIFDEVPYVVNELQNRGIELFIASGDRKTSLMQLANFINIPKENVFDTASSRRKKEIINQN